jgi:hypothetical protein
MKVAWDALGQVIREVLCWVPVLVIGTETFVMAHIFSLRDLGIGVVPQLFLRAESKGLGTSDGLYAVVISNICIVRTLGNPRSETLPTHLRSV